MIITSIDVASVSMYQVRYPKVLFHVLKKTENAIIVFFLFFYLFCWRHYLMS